MKWYLSTRARLGLALLASSLVCVGLWGVAALANTSWEFAYLSYNLVLAWVPLFLALWLESILRIKLWSSWQALAVTLLWLGFLPNSFYLVTDFVHLNEVPRVDLVLDVIMFGAFAVNGLVLGYLSLFLVHGELRKRLSVRTSGFIVGCVLLLSSFAIYIGRDLRWNTWDLLLSPASLLLDISERLLNIGSNLQVFSITFGFFFVLGSVYMVILYLVRALRQQKSLS